MASLETPEIAGSNERRFRVCQKCGLLTPANTPSCVECGYRSFEAVQAEKESRFVRDFIAHPTPFTYIILGINVLVFLLMFFCGGTANGETLLAFGAKENGLILKGEYWRFITPIFIHNGLIHMAFNSYALVALAPTVEKLYGSARFVVMYMLAGIAGVVGSFVWSMVGQPTLSVGASGAIFGLFGVLGVFGLKYRYELPETFRRGFVGRILLTIVINLYIGFALPGIDNAAHLGGLVAGVLAALIIPYKSPSARRNYSIWTLLQIVFLALITFSFIQIGRHYSGPGFSTYVLSVPRALGLKVDQDVREFLSAWNLGDLAFKDSITALERAEITGEKLDEKKVLGFIDGGLIALGRSPTLDKKTDQYRDELKQLLIENRDLIKKYGEGKLNKEEIKAQEEKYKNFEQDFCNWLKTGGRSYEINCGPEKTD